MKPRLFADLARRRLKALPAGPPTAALQQAKVDFIEALISRNYRGAQAANAVIACYGRPEPPLSAAERAKREERHRSLVTWVGALRELREEEARGIVRPPPQPGQVAEARALVERFRRLLADADSELAQVGDGKPQP
jgi:hypothetical protein